MFPRLTLVAAVLTLWGTYQSADAALISYGGNALGVSAVPATGLQGYVFYAGASSTRIFTGASSTSPVSYASITLDQNMLNTVNAVPHTNLLIAGTSYGTDCVYEGPIAGNTPIHMADIVLTGGAPGSVVPDFRLGVLEDHLGDTIHNNMASVTVSTAGSSLTENLLGNLTAVNDFYFFDVIGGHVGDTISLAVTNASAGGNALIGGITFSATPEPASLLTLGVGAIMLLRSRQREKSRH